MKAYMGLTCRSGTYSEVLKKLLFGLQLDQQNVFLLFGPVDILIQFNELEGIDDFVENWFNKVRTIGEEGESLLTKTLSLIVINEGRLPSENPYAFLFLHAQPKFLDKVQQSLLAFPEVLSADTVFGPYDLIASVKANGQEELERIIAAIQRIPGVESSVTSIVSPIKVLPDW